MGIVHRTRAYKSSQKPVFLWCEERLRKMRCNIPLSRHGRVQWLNSCKEERSFRRRPGRKAVVRHETWVQADQEESDSVGRRHTPASLIVTAREGGTRSPSYRSLPGMEEAILLLMVKVCERWGVKAALEPEQSKVGWSTGSIQMSPPK